MVGRPVGRAVVVTGVLSSTSRSSVPNRPGDQPAPHEFGGQRILQARCALLEAGLGLQGLGEHCGHGSPHFL